MSTIEEDNRRRSASSISRYLMIIGVIALYFAPAQSAVFASAPIVCMYSTQKGMETADCSNKNLEQVPENIRSKTEVLDLSYNRIEYLPDDSFNSCPNVKLLYLQYNSLSFIEPHVFTKLSSLTVLDISRNNGLLKLVDLPVSLLKLYLNHIPHLFLTEIRNNTLETLSQLAQMDTLHLSGNRMDTFPEFVGPMFSLIKLNVSNNKITAISVDQLARLCHIKYLYIDPIELKDTISEEKYCACIEAQNWTVTHSIVVQGPSICQPNGILRGTFNCDLTVRNSTEQIYQQCLAHIEAVGQTYITFGVVTTFVIISIFIIFYVRYRRRKVARTAILSNSMNASNKDHVDLEKMEEKPRLTGYSPCGALALSQRSPNTSVPWKSAT